MYAAPPLVASASVAIPGAGTSTVTIVAAPGVGFAIRLVGCQVSISRAAGANGDLDIRSGGVAIVRGGFPAGASPMTPPIPEPGIETNENVLLQGAVTSTAAAGTAFFLVYYFLDPLSP